MRISDQLRFNLFKTSLSRIKERIDRTQEMIASGKKILSPSDDPSSSSMSVKFEASLSLNERLKANLERVKMFDGFYETALNNIHELLTRAQEIAIQQASDTMNEDTRKSASLAIKGIIEQLVTIGNTKTGNIYIFGGKKTSSAPFSIDTDYNVTFNGTEDVNSVFVDEASRIPMGLSGRTLFYLDENGDGSYEFDIFSVLKNLKEALETNDVEGIRDALDGINKGLDLTEENLSYIGTHMQRIEGMLSQKDKEEVNLKEILSDMVDADIVSLVTDLNMLSIAYQSLLYTMEKLKDSSILNYIR